MFALTDYYEGGREHYRAWMEAAFGYDDTIVGSHAGISDTSQMLHVRPGRHPQGSDQAVGRAADSGVSGDPMKATAEIGRMGIEFKVNAAIAQYRTLKNPPQRTRRRRQSRTVDGDDPRRLVSRAAWPSAALLTTIAAAQAPNAPAPRLVKATALQCSFRCSRPAMD